MILFTEILFFLSFSDYLGVKASLQKVSKSPLYLSYTVTYKSDFCSYDV